MSLWRRMVARWKAGAGGTDDLRMDGMTNTLIGITYSHYKIHAGDSFYADFVDESMADNATIVLAFKTPTGTKRIHLFPEFITLVGAHVMLWEGATWNQGSGTLEPINNRFRQNTMQNSILLENQGQVAFVATNNVIANPQVDVSQAVRIHRHYAFGAQGRFSGGGGRDVNEWILKPDTQYAIIFTADGGSNKGQLALYWYEQEDLHARP